MSLLFASQLVLTLDLSSKSIMYKIKYEDLHIEKYDNTGNEIRIFFAHLSTSVQKSKEEKNQLTSIEHKFNN